MYNPVAAQEGIFYLTNCISYPNKYIELIEKRIIEVEGWLELDKTSVKQKQYQLYKSECQLMELTRKYTQLKRAIDYKP